MNPLRSGVLVTALHALLLVVAWQAGLRMEHGDGKAAPLRVALLPPTAVPQEARPLLAAPAVSLPAAAPMLAAPVITIAAALPVIVPAPPPAATAEAAPRTAEPPAPAPPAPAPTPTPTAPAEPTLTQARADRQRCPQAPHPAALRERGIEGVVHLRIRVGTDGLPSEVNVTSGSGWALMDQAALSQARGCRFLPARRGSEAVESWVEFPVRFVLNG